MSRVKLPQPTRLDRAIGYLFPGVMASRLQQRVKIERYQAMAGGRGGYDAGDRERRALRNARRLQGSADAALLPVADDLRALSDDARRNNPLAAGALDTIATKVVGRGLQLQASLDRKALGLSEEEARAYEETFERFWRHLWSRVDFSRRHHGAQLEYIAKYMMLAHGDVFVVKTGRRDSGDLFNLKIQLIPAARVCNKDRAADTATLAAGIAFADGVPAKVQIASHYPFDMRFGAQELTWQEVDIWGKKSGRRNVLHLMMATDADQTRGVPLLAPVIEALKQLSDWSYAELTAAVMNSVFAIVNKTEGGSEFPETGENAASTSDGLSRLDLTLEAGLVLDGLSPNESIEGFSATRPNPDFDPFFVSICRQIAVALGLSFELLVRHFTASYSASRAALMQVWEVMLRRRAWFSRAFHQDLYEEMLAEAHENGLVTLRGWNNPLMREAWCKARWVGPAQGQLNPKQEVDAALAKISGGLSTEEEQTAELCGGDYDANQDQRDREVARRRQRGELPPLAAPAAPEPPPADVPEDETREPS